MSDPKSLLPPNRSPLEGALEAVTERSTAVEAPFNALWDPWECPASVLPWLAWALGVQEWSARWPAACSGPSGRRKDVNLETTGYSALILVLVMTVVTLATRWGGVYVMSFVPIGYRVKQFIGAMSGSVLVALLAPMALEGDSGARLALLATAVTMLLLKKPLPAIAAGILTAALVRQF